MSKTQIIGTNQTTPGVMTYPSSLLTGPGAAGGGGDGQIGLLIKFHASSPADQKALRFIDSAGQTRFEIGKTSVDSYGQVIGSSQGLFNTAAALDGTRNPPCLRLPDTTGGVGTRIWGGTGTPSTTTIGGAAAVGDVYLRRDTPTTANQRLYICTSAGTPGTWTGIA